MTPAGYMAKKVMGRPEWLKVDSVVDIYSLSGCISDYFTDYVVYWKHNGYWLFDTPEIIRSIVESEGGDLDGLVMFYYEIYERQWNVTWNKWESFAPENTLVTNVQVPIQKKLHGFDAVSFFTGNAPECSPLSCNHIASEIPVNKHCLFDSLEEAKSALEKGEFKNAEPGPYRIFAVYTVE